MTTLTDIFDSSAPSQVIADLKLRTNDVAAQIVVHIYRDLTDRSGIDSAIEGADGDIIVDMIQGWYWTIDGKLVR